MSTEATRTRIVPVGFGCFHFAPAVDASFTLTGAEYVQAVTNLLGRSAGVEDIAVDADEEFESRTFNVDPPFAGLDDTGPFPDPGFTEIDFTLHIPGRLQQTLLEEAGVGRMARVAVEDFRVYLRYGYDMPVSGVASLYAPTADPTYGVVVVREFLRQESARSDEQRVMFECLGPSPAHADFYLVESEPPAEAPSPFWPIDYQLPAYHRYTYGFERIAFSSDLHR